MIIINKNQVYSDAGKYIHRVGTESYFKRSTILSSDTIDDFEEVDELPKFTKEEYDEKVAELVRQRYSESEEFAVQRKFLNTINGSKNAKAVSEYEAYNAYVDECKVMAKNPDLYNNNPE